MLSEHILLKAPILPLDNLRRKKKLRGREQEEGMRGRKVKWGEGCIKNEESEKWLAEKQRRCVEHRGSSIKSLKQNAQENSI